MPQQISTAISAAITTMMRAKSQQTQPSKNSAKIAILGWFSRASVCALSEAAPEPQIRGETRRQKLERDLPMQDEVFCAGNLFEVIHVPGDSL